MTTIKKKDAEGNVIEEIIDSTQQCSIEITKNAKGDTSWKVKIYEDDPEEMNEKIARYSSIADDEANNWKE